jgi:Ice-binding-like
VKTKTKINDLRVDSLFKILYSLTLIMLLQIASVNANIQEPVNLRSLDHFVVVAGSLISNIPGSAITGDIGLSPAAGSNITGFGATEITGHVYTVDATGPAGSITAASDLTTAKGDLTLAYNDAAGRTPIPAGPFLNPGAGNIGGLTLIPGLYKFTSGLSIVGSDLTLSGGANDVWIFQIASDLNVGNGIHVILAGGAQAANIFWQVGTSATLGTTSVFKGTILADQSISIKTGASLEGRALASIAAVTLASSSIVLPIRNTSFLHSKPGWEDGYALRASPQSIDFTVPMQGRISLKVLDVTGQFIRTLFEADVKGGEAHSVPFRANGLAGVYFLMLQLNGKTQLQSCIWFP